MVAAHSNESLRVVSRLHQEAAVPVSREPERGDLECRQIKVIILACSVSVHADDSADAIVHARQDVACDEYHPLKDLHVDLVSKRHTKLFQDSHRILPLVLQLSLSLLGRRSQACTGEKGDIALVKPQRRSHAFSPR